jgi:hypothetical protein
VSHFWGHVEKRRVLDALLAEGWEPDAHEFRRRGFPAVHHAGNIIQFGTARDFTIVRLDECSLHSNPRYTTELRSFGGYMDRGWVQKTVASMRTWLEDNGYSWPVPP